MKALVVVSAALFVLGGCVASPERSQMREAQYRAICQSSGFEPGTYGFRYCVIKTAYLRYVAEGFGSQAGSFAFVSIENNRQRCLDGATAGATAQVVEAKKGFNQILDESGPRWLSQFIEELGPERGRAEYDRQMRVAWQALEEAFSAGEVGMRERCNLVAINQYQEWLPVLFQSEPSGRFSYDDFRRRYQLDRIEGELRQLEARQRQIEQQQRNTFGCLQNLRLGAIC